MELKGPVGRIFSKALTKAVSFWYRPIILFHARDDKFGVDLFPGIQGGGSIDERIAQIDHAKVNLTAALSAIDELKTTAEKNKMELQDALERIQDVRQHKAAAEKELENVKQIAQADVEVFRKLAGVPSRRDIARERFIGFVLGVIASLLATFIWWLFTK